MAKESRLRLTTEDRDIISDLLARAITECPGADIGRRWKLRKLFGRISNPRPGHPLPDSVENLSMEFYVGKRLIDSETAKKPNGP